MSLELVNTFATLGTFLVIAATAIAALVQLRHARSSNQIVALNELTETFHTLDISDAVHFTSVELPRLVDDPAFRYAILNPSKRTAADNATLAKVRTLGNFYESLGLLVRFDLLDQTLALNFWGNLVQSAWERLAPIITIYRRSQGSAIYENFEYLTVLAQDLAAARGESNYPSGLRRIELKDEWLEADRQYAASLATT